MKKAIAAIIFGLLLSSTSFAGDLAEELKELNKLYQEGVLTKEEFTEAKSKVIGIDKQSQKKQETKKEPKKEKKLIKSVDEKPKDEKILGRRDYIYLFDNDQDGNGPNIHKILSKSNDKEISFFVNPSNTSTSDIIDEAVKFNHSNEKYFIVENNDLIFFCVPLQESITKKNSSNIDLFIKDRIKKKKLIKFKVPNGIYDICETEFVPRLFKNIDEFTEPNELLGHYIVRKNF